MKHKTLNALLIVLTSIVLIIGSWLLGKREGARQTLATVSEQLSTAEAQSMIDQLQVSLSEKEQAVYVLSQDLKAREARAQALLRQLDEQMRDNISNASELALYHKIETSENPRGIEVESIMWRASQPATLEVTIIQWQGRNRVSGELSVVLGYSTIESDSMTAGESGGEEGSLVGTETGFSDGDAALTDLSNNLKIDIEAQPFDFRFFQKIRVSLPSAIGYSEAGNVHLAAPDYVQVQLTPSDNRVKAVKTQIPWKDISE